MPRGRFLSMRWKLVLASALVEIVMLSALVWNSVRLIEHSLEEQFSVRLAEVSHLLNTSIAPSMAAQDYAPIADVFRQTKRSEGIQYFVLTDKRGRVLLADGWDAATPVPAEQQLQQLELLDSALHRFDTRLPIELAGQTYGYLNYGISTEFIAEARRHLVNQSFLIAATEVFLSVVLLVLLGIWITRHLATLQVASEAVARGQYDVRLPVETSDEVGRLTATFNVMAARIQQQMGDLRDSEARYRRLLTISTDWYWEQDADFRFVSHDPGGLSNPPDAMSRELIGKCRWELEHTLDAAAMAEHRRQLAAHEAFREFEIGYRLTDGQTHYFSVSGDPLFDASGVFLGYRGTAREITDRKVADLRLQESEKKLINILESAESYIFIKDLDGTYQFANRKLCDFYNVPVQDLLGRRARDIVAPAAAAEIEAQDERVLHHGETLRFEERQTRPGSHQFLHFWTIKLPLRDAEGQIYGLCGMSTDITERKLAEETQRLAASVFAEAHDGIIIADALWQIVDINPAALTMLDYRREMALGVDVYRFQSHSEDVERLEEVRRTLHDDGHWQGEMTGRRRDGSLFPERVTISTVRADDAAVTHHIIIFADITDQKAQQDRLEHLAHFDALTQLPNRVLLADRMQQAIAQARRERGLLAVAYLDLDDFKPVNDAFGHEAGDQLLVQVADRLRHCVRGGDTVSRLGGDEFALLIRVEDHKACNQALNRILTALAEPYLVAGQQARVSASIGATLFPLDAADSDMLLRHADQAMYAAKQLGRNRFHLFDPELDERARSQHALVSRIETALANAEFELHYQPKVDMRRGVVIGAEALIRWQHPERGLVMPGEFLPLIEDSDLIVALGDWVMAAAMAQMDAWRQAGIQLPVSINIAARQLQSTDFVARLHDELARWPDVPSNWLELEILESAALDDILSVGRIITECQALGVTFALDDFGTGYSSLTYFKRLPAQSLKIDQSFIRDMLVDPEDLAIVEGVIGLARSFHREVIAEGVETAAHGARLCTLGCDLAQGYGIARPMPPERLVDWLAAFRPDPGWLDSRGAG